MAQHKNIDIIPDSTVNRIHLSQGDIGRTLIFYLFENALSWSVPASSTIKCQGTKPSGFGFSVSCTYSGNAVTCVTTDEMTDEYGQIEAELVITSSDESQVFGTSNFILDIERNPHPDGTVDGDAENPVIANLNAVITQAVDSWLDEHPEATTTVEDGSLTYKKLVTGTLGYVSYKMFGAVLDGETDDSEAVIAAHEYANEHNLPVVQNGGSLYLNFSVEVKTSCYLNLDFIMDEDSTSHAYRIVPDDATTLTYVGAMDAGANGVVAPLESLYGMSAVVTCENSTWSLGNRSGTPSDTSEKWHIQNIAYDEQGNVISSGLFTENDGTFEFTNVHSLATKSIEFVGAKVITRFTNNSVNFKTFIRCFRNNTVIRNISVVNEGTAPSAQINNAGTLIAIRHCANVIVENVNGFNQSSYPWPSATTSFSPYAYVYEAGNCFNTTFRNINVEQGWGAGATFFVDNTYFENCNISRIDNHYGCLGNFIIRNCTFNGVSVVNLGYGNGNVVIDGCIFHKTNLDKAIKSRTDFNSRFSGKLSIQNCVLDCNTSDTPIYIYRNKANTGNFPTNNPKIFMDKVVHKTPSTVNKVYTISADTDSVTADSQIADNRMMLVVSDSYINGVSMAYIGSLIVNNSVFPKASKIRASNMLISNSLIKTDEFPMLLRKDSTKGICKISDCVFSFINSKPSIQQLQAVPLVINNCTFLGTYDTNYLKITSPADLTYLYNCRVPNAITIASGANANEYNTAVISALADMSIEDFA